MLKNSVLIILIASVISFLVGAVTSSQMGWSFGVGGNGVGSSYQAGWDAARDALKKSGNAIVLDEYKNVDGIVEKISDNKIYLKNVVSPDPLEDPALSNRVINVTKDTKFSIPEEKVTEVLQKQVEEFEQKVKATESTNTVGSQTQETPQVITFPESYEMKQTNLSDIKIGQNVLVLSTDNIAGKKEFDAAQISLPLGLRK